MATYHLCSCTCQPQHLTVPPEYYEQGQREFKIQLTAGWTRIHLELAAWKDYHFLTTLEVMGRAADPRCQVGWVPRLLITPGVVGVEFGSHFRVIWVLRLRQAGGRPPFLWRFGRQIRGLLLLSLQNAPSCMSPEDTVVCKRTPSLNWGTRVLTRLGVCFGFEELHPALRDANPRNVSLQFRFSNRCPSSKSFANLAIV